MSTQLRAIEAQDKLNTLERWYPRSINRFTLFGMLSSQPLSAVSLARRLRRTEQVRGMIEHLRNDGLPA